MEKSIKRETITESAGTGSGSELHRYRVQTTIRMVISVRAKNEDDARKVAMAHESDRDSEDFELWGWTSKVDSVDYLHPWQKPV